MNVSIRKAIFRDKEQQAFFELHGYLVVSLLNDEEVATLSSKYSPDSFDHPEGFYSTSFSENEQLKGRLEQEIISILQPKAKSIFYDFQELGACYLSKSPGKKGEMPLHQDWTVVDEDKYDSLTIWVPLVDVNERNGALQVVPGSHRFSKIKRSPFYENPINDIQEVLKEDSISINLKAGEAIIFSQALVHSSPANLSESNRLAVTYGLIDKEAELLFYYKNKNGQGEKFKVPIDFFKHYNTQIGARPRFGESLELFDLSNEKISLQEYKKAKRTFQLKKSKQIKMIPIFKNPEHQQFFEDEGYLTLPLLERDDINYLKNYYTSLNLKDENGFGFHVSMDGLSAKKCTEVRKTIWDLILPKLDKYLENYKPFVASYVIKERNPKGVVPAHQDWTFVDKEEEGYCSITCWTALVDTTLDNGCMGIIRGSHRLMQNHRPSPSPQTPVPLSEHMFSVFPYLKTLEMKAGEVLFFDNRTFHASPPNTEDDIRLAVGVGVTQKDASLIHYHLKPDGKESTLQKYAINEDFFLKYNNSRLSEMYESKSKIEDYKLLEEVPYHYDKYSSEELVELIKNSGNEFNVAMCEKLSVLFGYDMSGKKQEETKEEEEEKQEERIVEDRRSFFEIYTPANIVREIKYKITGK